MTMYVVRDHNDTFIWSGKDRGMVEIIARNIMTRLGLNEAQMTAYNAVDHQPLPLFVTIFA